MKAIRILKNTGGEPVICRQILLLLMQKAGVRSKPAPNCRMSPATFESLIDVNKLCKFNFSRQSDLYLEKMYTSHHFDILGSGWVSAGFNESAYGLEGHVFTSPTGRTVSKLPMTSGGYAPIDWQRDIKSGFCFDKDAATYDIKSCTRPEGADVKMPLELSRLHHLPQMALFALNNRNSRETLSCEFCDEIYDFCENNTVGQGVNWYYAMDAAIRAANMLIAYDIFKQVTAIPTDFEQYFMNQIYRHGQFIMDHLEKEIVTGFSGNHYLSDLCGLLFIGAYIKNRKTRKWFDFAAREFLREVPKQFLPDGGSISYSTGYHRLTSEILAYSTAILLRENVSIPPECAQRIDAARIFLKKTVMPDGGIVQIGDNDSGHLFKLQISGEMKFRKDIKGVESYGCTESEDELVFQENPLSADEAVCALDAVFGTNVGKKPASVLTALIADGRVLPPSYAEKPTVTSFVQEPISPDWKHIIETHITLDRSFSPELTLFSSFGLAVFEDGDTMIFVRIPVMLRQALCGHVHNDFLHFELCYGTNRCFADQGSYLYTPLPHARNDFRSTKYHNVPDYGIEQNPLDGVWGMKIKASGGVVAADGRSLITVLRFGDIIHKRCIVIEGDDICITDYGNSAFSYCPKEPPKVSTGYGIAYSENSKGVLTVRQRILLSDDMEMRIDGITAK